MLKNHGLDILKEKAEQSNEDWVFGAIPSCLALIPEEQRFDYLPKGERQNTGEEKMDCASRSVLNILETKFNYLVQTKKLTFQNEMWLKEMGYWTPNGIEFSDAFVAINSGTTRQGNSLKAPLEAVRKQGLIPKSLLPQAESFDEHHNPERITNLMKRLGADFASRFFINYEKVYEKDYTKLLRQDMLDVAGFAWPEPVNGEYPRIDMTPNHAFVAIKNAAYFIFDNYIDSIDGDYIKKLASDYDLLDYGYRLSINQKPITPVKPFLERLTEWLRGLLSPQTWPLTLEK